MSRSYISAALRREVRDRAQERCEYCQMPEAYFFAAPEIDHIIAEKHGGLTDSSNLALSCILCNQRKGSDIASIDPMSQEITRIFHPRRDDWSDHFRFCSDGKIEPKTSIGRATAHLLQFNQMERLAERKILLRLGILSVLFDY